ncbi:transcriptional antitermination protein, putative [Nitrobacter sp. Nb-311A]|uniref:transcription termination/antitermination protein NusG n=1 Tax=Nitrobacter sp. Nb-311A TaxID=314253 RepID=UPI0000687A26|nr:transcription termination/antitermination NusG family protein [Nitrobacter sp. Nb-311A]EAQ36386.1 transcriptional antitermination protein, putative [Nitrobacter sp. Nb-311A]
MTASGQQWYVVQTHPHAEGKAAAHLRRQGFEVYLPRYARRRRHARRVDITASPLFPRYLFVAIDLVHQRWRAIRSTVGVTNLVYSGDEPAPVPDDVVRRLKQREDSKGCVQLDLAPRFSAGDTVRVVDGAFSDCLGLFESMSDGERVLVLLDLLGRKVRVTMDIDTIEAA